MLSIALFIGGADGTGRQAFFRPAVVSRRSHARFQHAGELLGDQRPAEVVALPLATLLGLKECELVPCFHAFRDDADARGSCPC